MQNTTVAITNDIVMFFFKILKNGRYRNSSQYAFEPVEVTQQSLRNDLSPAGNANVWAAWRRFVPH